MSDDRAERVHERMVQLIFDMLEDSDHTAQSLAVEAGIRPARFRRIFGGSAVLTIPEIAAIGQVLDFTPSDLVRLAEHGTDRATTAPQVRAWVTGALGDDADEHDVERIVRFLLANGVAAR